MIRTYQILELGLTLDADDEAFLRGLHADYQRFAVPAPPSGKPLAVRFQGGPAPFLEVNGRCHSLEGHPDPAQGALFMVHDALMDALEHFTVLHAAVLEAGPGALAICGSPGTGKTTLTLDLLDAGLGFLSDDFCPVHRTTGLVHPYPRSLWVREPRVGPTPADRMLHQGKLQVSPDPERFRVGRQPIPLRHFLFLDHGPEPTGPAVLEVRIRPAGQEAFLRDLHQLEGVHATRGPQRHALQIQYPRGGATVRALLAVLARHRDALWNVFALPTSNPDFTGDPVLQPIPSHEAAFLLLKERKQRIVALEGRPLEPGAFLAHLNELLANVPCHRLTGGPRDKRLALVLQSLDMG